PTGVALDGAGNIFIADSENDRIRRVDAGTGTITTVAGTGTEGFSGDGGPATAAELMGPSGVALDGAGNLFIADTGNARVRRVDAGTGTITTVAGGGADFPGDGGPATAAAFSPADVTFDGAGNLFIADWYGHRIREVRSDDEHHDHVDHRHHHGHHHDIDHHQHDDDSAAEDHHLARVRWAGVSRGSRNLSRRDALPSLRAHAFMRLPVRGAGFGGGACVGRTADEDARRSRCERVCAVRCAS